jgi:hypothetical protein
MKQHHIIWLFVFCAVFLVAVASGPAGRAGDDDEITLVDGQRIRGKIIEETVDKIILRTKSGLVTEFALDEVEDIKYSYSFERDFKKRFKKAKKAEDYYKLAKWCQERRHADEALKCLKKTIEEDPNHHKARRELGYIRYGDNWYTENEFYTNIRGMVRYKGKWVKPEDKEAFEQGLKKTEKGWVHESDEAGSVTGDKRENSPGGKVIAERTHRPAPKKRTTPPTAPKSKPKTTPKPKEPKPEKDSPLKKKPGTLFGPKKKKEKKRQKIDYSMYEDHEGFKPWSEAATLPTAHFIIKSNVSKKYMKYYGRMMEAFYKRFRRIFGIQRDFRGLKIKIYGTHQEFMQYERKGGGVGGYFSPGRGVTVYHGRFGGTGTTQTVLTHEGTHYFQSLIFGGSGMFRLPIWLLEGMAVFFEASEYVDGEFIIGVIPQDRLAVLQRGFLSGSYIKFDQLLNTRQGAFRGYHYAHAWAIVYYFLYSSKKNRSKFDAYLQSCKRGRGSTRDFFQACGISDVNVFEKDVIDLITRIHADMKPKDVGEMYKKIQQAKKNGEPLPPQARPGIRKRSKDGGYVDPSGGIGGGQDQDKDKEKEKEKEKEPEKEGAGKPGE